MVGPGEGNRPQQYDPVPGSLEYILDSVSGVSSSLPGQDLRQDAQRGVLVIRIRGFKDVTREKQKYRTKKKNKDREPK